eukprot:6205441-Pleurochrysis_carterae.AAC.1
MCRLVAWSLSNWVVVLVNSREGKSGARTRASFEFRKRVWKQGWERCLRSRLGLEFGLRGNATVDLRFGAKLTCLSTTFQLRVKAKYKFVK